MVVKCMHGKQLKKQMAVMQKQYSGVDKSHEQVSWEENEWLMHGAIGACSIGLDEES